LLPYTEPLLHHADLPELQSAGIVLDVWREDLNHSQVSGNKWWKLRGALQQPDRIANGILTFGGAWSNHLYAVAAACSSLKIRSVGVVRGEEPETLSNTLTFCRQQGMQLEFVSRQDFKELSSVAVYDHWQSRFGPVHILPEGGSDEHAVASCSDWSRELLEGIAADYEVVCLPVGTGGTMAGMVRGFGVRKKLIGFSALGNGGFLEAEVRRLSGVQADNWTIETRYAFGGYGKRPAELVAFIRWFREATGIPLDVVYTGKMVAGIIDLAQQGFFPRGTRVLALHTGGLQGNLGTAGL